MKSRAPSEKLKHIQLLLLDADGVLTDGSIIYSDNGSEIKIFNVKDGLGLKLVREAGVKVGIVTSRKSKALCHRCKDLGIQYLFDGVQNKAKVLARIVDQTGVDADNTAYIGDDLPDVSLMRQVGLSIAVSDAHKMVREKADWITSAR